MPKKEIFLTSEGFLNLENELNTLKFERRPKVLDLLKEARALGDLSENADYDAAKNDQAEIEGRIKKIEKMLDNVEIIEKTNIDVVGLGTTVSIRYVDDEDETDEYRIVGSQEADPFQSKISNESPIAKAIMNKKVGDIVDVESPNGVYKIEIIEIK